MVGSARGTPLVYQRPPTAPRPATRGALFPASGRRSNQPGRACIRLSVAHLPPDPEDGPHDPPTAGAVLASVLTVHCSRPRGASRRLPRPAGDEETCFGEEPTVELESGEPYTGGSGPDVILGGGSVNGGDGDDLICDAAYVLGGDGDDRIRMLGGATAKGNAGDDEFVSITVDADVAGPVLDGGPGNDIFWGGTLGETIYGGAGVDVVWAGGGDDEVVLGSGNDKGYGQPGNDTFYGMSGDDFVDGGLGTDTVDGGSGRDTCRAVEVKTSCKRVR